MNAELSAEERTELLLSAMTINEKISQILNMKGFTLYNRKGNTVEISQELVDLYKDFPGVEPGSWIRADLCSKRDWENGLTPELIPVWYNKLQKFTIEETRLGIPLLLGGHTGHGVFALGGSVFPTGIGMASSWNYDLVKSCFDAIADETSACNSASDFHATGPTQDVARDPRWSRIEETFGEDPIKEMSFACMMEFLYKLHLSGTTFDEVGFELRYDKKQGDSKMRVSSTIKNSLFSALRFRKLKKQIRKA